MEGEVVSVLGMMATVAPCGVQIANMVKLAPLGALVRSEPGVGREGVAVPAGAVLLEGGLGSFFFPCNLGSGSDASVCDGDGRV